MPIKINRLEIENVKRIKAVTIEPTKDGLTVIGGRNGQGKTSVLDSIAWALGGENYRPSKPKRDGSVIDPVLKVTMSNGLIVERKGKNSSLKVTDPTGKKAGQALLNSFVEKLALDLPRFLNSSNREKADTLLQIIGVGDQLEELEEEEKAKYSERHAIGQIADQKKKFAREHTYYPDAPKEPISVSDLIKQQQDILARNGERQKWINEREQILADIERTKQDIYVTEGKLADLKESLADLEHREKQSIKDPKELEMESTSEIEASIANIEKINEQVKANTDKLIAEKDAQEYQDKYDELTKEIEGVREAKRDLLKNADLPLAELSVEDGEIIYMGQKWDNMSGSEQMKVATAIIRKLNPDCGFILLDRLEQMDTETLKEFGEWLSGEGLQAIATRVSTGTDGDCTIIIEDGQIAGQEAPKEAPKQKEWKAGEF